MKVQDSSGKDRDQFSSGSIFGNTAIASTARESVDTADKESVWSRLLRHRVLVLIMLGTVVAAAWLLPGKKVAGVLGRLSYPQFLTAVVLTGMFLSFAVVVLVPRHRAKSIAFRVLAIWLALLFAVGLCEGLCGYLSGSGVSRNPWYLVNHEGTTSSELLPYERPAGLYWEGKSYGDTMLLGESDPEQRQLTFVTDYQGFRNSDDLKSAELIFIGDSYTEAGNVAEDETFVQQTAKSLGMTARNLGRAGYSAPEELVVLQQYGLACQPTVVVWQISESNDLLEAFQPTSLAGRPMPSRFEDNWRAHSPSYRLFRSIRSVDWPLQGEFESNPSGIRGVRFQFMPGPEQYPRNHPGWRKLAQSIEAGARQLKENGVRLFVLVIPMKFQVLRHHVNFDPGIAHMIEAMPPTDESERLASWLRRECDNWNATLIDPADDLRQAAASGQLGYLQYDTHLSPIGHRVVSETISSALRSHLESRE